MLIKWLMGNPDNSKRSSVLWNAVGGMMNAGQAAIILIFISYKLGLTVAGIVTIAYAIANVFLSISKYGIRNYQVTDIKNAFSFGDYFYSRCFTTAAAIILFLCYLAYTIKFGEYSPEKVRILFEITILKLIDAFEDVYIGRYQQVGRFDIGAKILAIRMTLSTAVISIFVLCGIGIEISLLSGILLSIILDIYLIRRTFAATQAAIIQVDAVRVKQLLKSCMPLCIGTTLSIYIGNIPKYMIDVYMNEEIQAIFGYIMMPVFVIMLFSQFIYQPMVKGLGDLWNSKNYHGFKRSVIKQCLIVAVLAFTITVGSLLLGLPILSLLYNVDLGVYKSEFFILLLGGGFYALAYYLNVPITTIRMQKYIAYGYALATVLSIIFGRQVVLSKGMMGAGILYLSINAFLAIVCILILAMGISKKVDPFT